MIFWQFVRILAFSIVYGLPLSLIFSYGLFAGIRLSRDVALAIYSAQIQLFAIFAALAPIFFVVFQNRRLSRTELKYATGFAIIDILSSLVGMIWSFANMAWERFDLSSITLPFFFGYLCAVAVIGFLLVPAGFAESIFHWIFIGRRRAHRKKSARTLIL